MMEAPFRTTKSTKKGKERTPHPATRDARGDRTTCSLEQRAASTAPSGGVRPSRPPASTGQGFGREDPLKTGRELAAPLGGAAAPRARSARRVQQGREHPLAADRKTSDALGEANEPRGSTPSPPHALRLADCDNRRLRPVALAFWLGGGLVLEPEEGPPVARAGLQEPVLAATAAALRTPRTGATVKVATAGPARPRRRSPRLRPRPTRPSTWRLGSSSRGIIPAHSRASIRQ